jgi:hypothetical protein
MTSNTLPNPASCNQVSVRDSVLGEFTACRLAGRPPFYVSEPGFQAGTTVIVADK